MAINFCTISPTPHLHLIKGRPVHLVLAHLIEEDSEYTEFYLNESNNGSKIIVDNSAFELSKRGLPMMDPEKVMDLAEKVKGDYVVLSDYPAEHQTKTIETAVKQIPELQKRGFKSFFVPQSEIGDLEGYIEACQFGIDNCDLTGISILGSPNAFGKIEKDNKLQRFMSRWKIMKILNERNILTNSANNKLHFLGMLDGPNEIELCKPFERFIFSWDSSSPAWLGLHGMYYDQSPTGLLEGKFEKEVDFGFNGGVTYENRVKTNIETIDRLCK